MIQRFLLILVFHIVFAATAHASSGAVLVFPFENLSKFKNIDWIGEGLAELVADRLQSEKSLYVYSREERLLAYERIGIPENTIVSHATAIKIGWETDADAIIVGTYDQTPEGFLISSRVIDLALSKSSEETTSTGKLENIFQLVNEHSRKLLKELVPNPSATFSDDAGRFPAIPESAFESYIRGLLQLDRRASINFFLQSVRLYPEYWAAVFHLGRAYHLEGDYKTSNLWLEKIGNGKRDSAYAYFLMGLNYFFLGEYARAVPVFKQIGPTYETLVNLGAALSSSGHQTEAISVWRRAIDGDALAVQAYFNIGYVSLLRQDADEAVKYLRQALKLQPRDGEALFLLARAYEELGQLGESKRAMGQAVRLSSRTQQWATQPLPRLERLIPQVNITALRQSQENALPSERQSANRAKGQNLVTRLERVQNRIDAQLYGEAIKELNAIINLFPNSADAHLLLAQVYERQKEPDLAIREYQRSIGIRSTADLYVMLSKAYKSVNQIYSALLAAEEALALESGHTEALALKLELEKLLSPPRRNQP